MHAERVTFTGLNAMIDGNEAYCEKGSVVE